MSCSTFWSDYFYGELSCVIFSCSSSLLPLPLLMGIHHFIFLLTTAPGFGAKSAKLMLTSMRIVLYCPSIRLRTKIHPCLLSPQGILIQYLCLFIADHYSMCYLATCPVTHFGVITLPPQDTGTVGIPPYHYSTCRTAYRMKYAGLLP